MESRSPVECLDEIAAYALEVAKAALRKGDAVQPFALLVSPETAVVIQLFDFAQRVDVLRRAITTYQSQGVVVVFGVESGLQVRIVSTHTDQVGACHVSAQGPLTGVGFSHTIWAPARDEFSSLRGFLMSAAPSVR